MPARAILSSPRGSRTHLGLTADPKNGTKLRVMTTRLRILLCLTSDSVDTLPAPEKHGTASAGPAKRRNRLHLVPIWPIKAR